MEKQKWKSIKETCICEEVDRFPISEYRDNSLCLLHHPKEITTDGRSNYPTREELLEKTASFWFEGGISCPRCHVKVDELFEHPEEENICQNCINELKRKENHE